MHACPLFMMAFGSRFGSVAPRSASSRMIAADFPPSSSVQRLSRSPHRPPIRLPAADEPVNEILSTPGWVTRCSPTSRPAGTTDSTPSGSPASAKISASRKASSGVSGAGLNTTVQPAASAGASLAEAMKSGTFHGAIAPTTPTGSFVTRTSGLSTPVRTSSKAKLAARLGVVVEDHRRRQHLAELGPRHRASPSRPRSISAISTISAVMASATLARIAPRSAGAIRGHGPWSKAWRAAATALSTSASVASGTRATTSSVDGEIDLDLARSLRGDPRPSDEQPVVVLDGHGPLLRCSSPVSDEN